MKKGKFFVAILFFIIGTLFTACDNFDSWSTSADDVLSFSTDTVDFETVLTSEVSSTRTLIVYNRNKAGIRISSVTLEGNTDNNFRINIDGEKMVENTAYFYEVRTNDSILLRLNCSLPFTDKDELTHYSSTLVFNLENGRQQRVHIKAEGMDAERVENLTISANTVFDKARPYLVSGPLVVDTFATLTIKEGVRLFFRDNGSMMVYGSLRVEGEPSNPVIFRGDRTDRMLSNVPYDYTPDRWWGVTLDSVSHDNYITSLDLHSSRYGIRAQKTDITISSSQFREIAGEGLNFIDVHAKIENTLVANTSSHNVYLLGGDCRFTFCSFLQYYAHKAERGDALFLSDLDNDNQNHPITLHSFSSCLMMGYADDVIHARFAPKETKENLLFNYCYMRTVASPDDARFQSCTYDADVIAMRGDGGKSVEDRQLFTTFTPSYVTYDFHPTDASPWLGKADTKDSELITKDLDGKDRINDPGCYQK